MTELISALDIGTTKICAVICQVDDDDQIRVLGVGQVPSRGLRRGVGERRRGVGGDRPGG